MFFLKPADGALGAHTYAVTEESGSSSITPGARADWTTASWCTPGRTNWRKPPAERNGGVSLTQVGGHAGALVFMIGTLAGMAGGF